MRSLPRSAIVFLLLSMLCGPAEAVECIDYGDYLHAVPGVTAKAGFRGIACNGDIAYVVSATAGLLTYDVSEPASPVLLASLPVPPDSDACLLERGRLYVAAGASGLMVFDVSTATRPVLLGTVPLPGVATGLAGQARHLYVAAGAAGLHVLRLPRRELPELVGTCDTPGSAFAVTVAGDMAYVADDAGGLQVIDVVDRAAPRIVAALAQPGLTHAIAHEGTWLYVASRDFNVRAYDIVDPAAPRLVGSAPLGGWPRELAVRAGTLFALSSYYVEAFQLAADGRPTRLGRVYLGGAMHMDWAGDRLVVTDTARRLWQIDTTRLQPAAVVGQVDIVSNRGYVNSACLAGNRVFIGRSINTVTVVDIANPVAPRLLTQMPVTGYCFKVAVEGQYAFVAAGSGGFAVCDISDIMHPQVIATIPTPDWTYDVVLTPGYAHVAVSDTGYWIIDISDPEHPFVASRVNVYDRNYQVVVSGGYAYLACRYAGLQVVDVRDPLHPRTVGRLPVTASSSEVFVRGNWLFIDDDWVGIRAVDITNPAAPVSRGLLPLRCTVHGLHLDGDVLYAATTWEGLLVIDVSDPARMRRHGVGPLVNGGDAISDVIGDERAIYEIRDFQSRSVRTWPRQCDSGPEPVAVSIDIEPGDPRNRVSCDDHDRGVIKVALLATPGVDPRAVEPASLRFGPDGAEPLRSRQMRDVDGDGAVDLVMRFHADATGIRCGAGTAALAGKFTDGRPFLGEDRVATRVPGDDDPREIIRLGASPNPFNPTTRLAFTVVESGSVNLVVYDLAGRLVRTLVAGELPAGPQELVWDGRDDAGMRVASGAYVARLQSGGAATSVRLLLLK